MPADLDQFGCQYSHGAVVGGKGLVQLGHMAANGRRFVDQVNLKTRRAKIKRSLNTADPSTDNHNITKIDCPSTFYKAVQFVLCPLLSAFIRFDGYVKSPSGRHPGESRIKSRAGRRVQKQ